jgi:GT2 family glycosyltransferase
LSIPKPRVLATVLTFDAPATAINCVELLQRQTTRVDRILVVDNHGARSPDLSTLERTGDSPVRLLRLSENLGPAGGHAAALTAFLESGFEWAWVMDDDVEPDPGCLTHLLNALERSGGGAFAAPATYDTVTGARRDEWGWYGMLFPRLAIERVGIPRADLFWGLEDQDFLLDRMPLAGFPPVRANDALVKLEFRPPDAHRPSWKYYYEARNRVYQYLYGRRHLRFSVRAKSLVNGMCREVLRIQRIEDDRAAKFAWMLRGIFDGLIRRMGKRVEPDHPDRPWSRQS